MLRDIFNTISTKVIVATANLLLIVLITNYLGAEGKGEMSLFVLNLSLVIMLNDFFGGAALVYIIPRSNLNRILSISIAWGLMAGAVIAIFTQLLKIDQGFYLHIFGIGFLHSLQSIASHVLLAKEKIKIHNIINVIPILVILLLCGVLFYFQDPTIDSYLQAMYFGYGIAALFGLIAILRASMTNKEVIDDPDSLLGLDQEKLEKPEFEAFKLGFWVQIGNVIQLLNYRLAFYLMADILNKGELGRFSTAINLAESTWLISKGISAIQYSKIANSSNPKEAVSITKRLLGINCVGSLIIYICVLLLPSDLLAWVFGDEFDNLSKYLLYLAPGIVVFSVSGIFSHYFAGIGKHNINTISAIIGLVPTVIFGPYLIRNYGIFGACQVYNVSYILSTVFLILYFRSKVGVKFSDFIPTKSHIRWFKRKIRRS
jgi:O-antigen/teichoic acid export membrane protein